MKDQNSSKVNIDIFEETLKKCQNDKMLNSAIIESNKAQQIILQNDPLEVESIIFNNPSQVTVTMNTTFGSARQLIHQGKVCVLNFANPHIAGGGIKFGSSAQEECLCAQSTLYSSISTVDCVNNFYNPHRFNSDALGTDDIIYTPDVIIFRDDKNKILPRKSWVKVDVITCAAPIISPVISGGIIDDGTLEKVHIKRGRRILQSAIKNGCDTIVLGAFGCGVFGNNPKIVASAYSQLVEEFKYAFKTINFAIYCKNPTDSNYLAFREKIKCTD